MLSVVIITKNEERNIRECLESCKWADEIIIIDAESTDNTVKLASEYTDRIYIRPWRSYADAKNYGISLAKSAWVLSLDADERLPANLIAEIKMKVGAATAPIEDGFFIPRLTYFCGKPLRHGGCYPDWQLRLFKNGKGRFAEVLVHEGVEISGGGKCGHLKNDIIHYSYRTVSQYWEKFNCYTSLAAEQNFARGKQFRFYRLFMLPARIFYQLIIRLGILDGFPGGFYHIFTAVYSFVKHVKLWELEKNEGKNENSKCD
jgi:(heptosyl)LPS beta-1,4-glucosyltransferase